MGLEEPQSKKCKILENDTESTTKEKIKLPGQTSPNPLSKKQLKKQKKMEKYQQTRKERRLKEKERQRQRRKDAAAQGIPRTAPTRKELKKKQIAAAANSSCLQVVIDLDFDDLMNEQDIAKCVKQCLRMYTINRRSDQPCSLHFTGLKEDGNIHAGFKKNDGWENWHVKYHFNETHLEANDFKCENLIYLTCESDTVLTELQREKVYIIGGLVDHNHHKGLCHDRATKAGITTARLPLSENVVMKTREVLSTYHVFEILLRVAEGKTWSEAILATLPLRKGAQVKKENVSNLETNDQITKIENLETKSSNVTLNGAAASSLLKDDVESVEVTTIS